MKMAPSISVGEAERGGAWGYRVVGMPLSQDDRILTNSGFKGTLSDEEDTEEESESSSQKYLQSPTFAQRILLLKHKHLKSKKDKRSSPQPHASHQSPPESSAYSLRAPSPPIRPASCSPRPQSRKQKGSKQKEISTSFIQRKTSNSGTALASPEDLESENEDFDTDLDTRSPNISRRLFGGGSRPISTLARPLVALAVPGMFLVCKYNQYKRAHQEASKRRAAERELNHLNQKIDKLLNRLDEHEAEPALSREEECVICVNAKATMQTFPCAHRVVCRKCFVKTIQMAVSQRHLPLRCVVCRSKILKLRQSSGMPTSVSQYSIGDSRRIQPSYSLHSFASGTSGTSALSGTSSIASEGGVRKLKIVRHSARYPQMKKVYSKSGARSKESVYDSKTDDSSSSSISPMSPETPYFHLVSTSQHSNLSQESDVEKNFKSDPSSNQNRFDSSHKSKTLPAVITPVTGTKTIRVHIRENKVAPQESGGRLPTIKEYSEFLSDKDASEKEMTSSTRIR